MKEGMRAGEHSRGSSTKDTEGMKRRVNTSRESSTKDTKGIPGGEGDSKEGRQQSLKEEEEKSGTLFFFSFSHWA